MARVRVLAEAARPSGRVELRDVLDTPRDPAFDRLTRLTAQCLRAPVALMTFVDAHRQWFKSSYGLKDLWAARRETPLTHSFCQYVVRFKRSLIVPDARVDPLVKENLAIPELGVVAYLGVPLAEEDGTVLGSMSVIDSQPRAWSAQDVELLQDFAALAMMELRLRVQDVQQREVEASLRQAQKLEALGQLSGGIAHDFKNTLFALRGYIDLLEREVSLPPPFADYIAELRKGVDRGSALVRQLLAFSRKEPRREESVNVNRVVLDMESMLRCAVGTQVRFTLSLQEPISDVHIESTQLQQVILNLVLNARDATPAGGVIGIRTREYANDQCMRAGNPCHIELAVHDSGCGMDQQTMRRIFEPFFTTKGSADGTGLGLFTVYGIVEQAGGCMEVESEPGQGTCFRILLPRCRSS